MHTHVHTCVHTCVDITHMITHICICIDNTYMYMYMCIDICIEKEMTAHSSILAWDIPWTKEPGGLQSMDSPELDTT